MIKHRVAAAAATLLLGLLTACGSADDGGAARAEESPTGPSDPTVSPPAPAAAAGLCDRVGAARLRSATGQGLTVGASDDPGYTCTAAAGSAQLAVSWRLTAPAESLDQVSADLGLDLTGRRVQLPGHVDAWLLTGDLMDQRIARLVTITGDHTVMVDATTSRLEDGAVSDARLARVAQAVASAYVE